MTSLPEAKTYPRPEVAQVYRWHWRVESYIDRLKNIWEIERAGKEKQEHLEQDFFGVLFLSTLESVLSRRAGHELTVQSHRRRCKHRQQVNRAVSYSALLDHTLVLLTETDKSPEQVLAELHHLFQTNPTLEKTDAISQEKKSLPVKNSGIIVTAKKP